MKTLLIEDDAKTVAILSRGLTEAGFEVESAGTGEQGLARALKGGIDLIVLDVGLPCGDGWNVVRALRSAGHTLPVIFLTARDAIPDRVQGLELGADDYLIKPFAFAELLARIRTLLRRGGRTSDVVKIADLEIDLIRQKAIRGGQALDLTPKEFMLLSLLARSAGEPFSRATITAQVWDVDVGHDTNVVDVHIRRLRAKADDPFPTKLIHTVRGVGYVLEARP